MREIPMFFRYAPLLLLLSMAACGADEDARLGGEGELCFADGDCREDLICTDETCVCADGSCGGTGTAGGTTGGTSSNGVVDRTPTCDELCDRLKECLGPNLPGNCVSDCESETRLWSDAEYNTFTSCAYGFTCDQILSNQLEGCTPEGS